MFCSNHYDRLRTFLAPMAALLWTAAAALILYSGQQNVAAGFEAVPASDLNLFGSVAFLLATLLLFAGHLHKVVMTAMAVWFLSSVAILIAPDAETLSRVHMIRITGVAIAAAWSFAATERDYLKQAHGGTDPTCGDCYPQFFPFLVLFLSNLPFIEQTFASDNTLYQAASVLTGAGDLTFAFSKQIFKPKTS